jgi:signal transduction histidine kinase
VESNFATTVSFSAAATCISLTVLAAYLGRGAASRHFNSAAVAGLAASVSVAFLAAWDRRRLSRFEGGLMLASVLGGLLSLVPDAAVGETVADRTVAWLGVVYREPQIGPIVSPVIALSYVEHVVAARAAFRMSRRNRRATAVAMALGLFCFVIVIDWMTALHVFELPYLADPALALLFLSIGSVVVADAAESAAKSAALERASVALAERENLAALGQLAAVVAHEVRNLVAIIFGALATLQRAARSEEDAKLLGIVGEEAERLKQLVARLLDAVRPFELQYSRRPAIEVVRLAISQVTASAGVEPTQVELVGAPEEDVECDEVLLGQAIANLVQNALVAAGRRSPVRVDVSVEPPSRPEALRIEISDDGEGVPPDARSRLFTPFFTTRATGTGLGLALVKRIAEAHGGSVAFEPGERGAKFILRVPLRERQVAGAAPPAGV